MWLWAANRGIHLKLKTDLIPFAQRIGYKEPGPQGKKNKFEILYLDLIKNRIIVIIVKIKQN